jgi:hypothetical protein
MIWVILSDVFAVIVWSYLFIYAFIRWQRRRHKTLAKSCSTCKLTVRIYTYWSHSDKNNNDGKAIAQRMLDVAFFQAHDAQYFERQVPIYVDVDVCWRAWGDYTHESEFIGGAQKTAFEIAEKLGYHR